MSYTIPTIGADANSLYTTLAGDLDINLDLPTLVLPPPIDFPTITFPTLQPIDAITVEQLTTETLDGTGVFDKLMRAVSAHLEDQFTKQRITGADYAKTYLGSVQAVLQYSVSFLLGKDAQYWANLNAMGQFNLAQAAIAKASAEYNLGLVQVQTAQYQNATIKLQAYTARNQYALSKMQLVDTYVDVLAKEQQKLLVSEQVDTARANTKDTMQDGNPISGLLDIEKGLKTAQRETAEIQMEVANAQISDTKTDGTAINGIIGVQKATAEAQRDLTKEQVETARAQTWDTHVNGTPIAGLAQAEKNIKTKQGLLIGEQYEAQRAQTRGTLSTGETVGGVMGAQTALYNQQVTSYIRDGENKALKLMLDSWIARKTIDEGVAVPTQVDVAAIDTSLAKYRANLNIDV